MGKRQPSHGSAHSLAQIESHDVSQQNGSIAQTQDSQLQPGQPGASWGVQPSSTHEPQSIGQLAQSSSGEQAPSPQPGRAPQRPQASQASLQQSPNETQASSQKQPAGATPPQFPAHESETGHLPQSPGHVEQDSVEEHWPSPQVAWQAPQSPGQLLQDSEPLQTLSPQNGWHVPQSFAQVPQDSEAPHTPSPQ